MTSDSQPSRPASPERRNFALLAWVAAVAVLAAVAQLILPIVKAGDHGWVRTSTAQDAASTVDAHTRPKTTDTRGASIAVYER